MIANIIMLCLFTIIFVIIIVEKICKEHKDSINKIFYNIQSQIDRLVNGVKKNSEEIEKLKKKGEK